MYPPGPTFSKPGIVMRLLPVARTALLLGSVAIRLGWRRVTPAVAVPWRALVVVSRMVVLVSASRQYASGRLVNTVSA